MLVSFCGECVGNHLFLFLEAVRLPVKLCGECICLGEYLNSTVSQGLEEVLDKRASAGHSSSPSLQPSTGSLTLAVPVVGLGVLVQPVYQANGERDGYCSLLGCHARIVYWDIRLG
jgi:hypothetical protein